MKNIKLLLFFLFLIPFINLISSESIGSYQMGNDIEIFVTCNNCTYVNFTTIKYPNSTNLLTNIVASSDGSYYYYNLDGDNLSVLGNYKYCYEAGNSAQVETGCNTFEITPTGYTQTTSQGINSAIYIILMIALTIFISVLGSILIKNDYLWVIGLFFLFLMVLLVIYDFWLGVEFYNNWTGFNSNSDMPQRIFYILIFVIVSGLLVTGILIFKHWKELRRWFINAKEDYEDDFMEDMRSWK